MTDYDPVARTRTLARIVGPYLIVLAVTLFVRQDTLAILLPAFMGHAALVLVTGAFTLMAGLAIIAAHHHWTGASAITISLIGIVAAIKGATLMIVPTLGAEITAGVMRAPPLLLVVAVVVLLLGLWLSVVGWRARA